MKGLLSLLIQLGCLVGLVATALVPAFLAEYRFGLHRPLAMLIGVGFLGLTLIALYCWIIHLQRRDRTILSTKPHELFNEVRYFQDHWEATVSAADDRPVADIWVV